MAKKWTARKLQSLRGEKGWTYRDLAKVLAVSDKQARNYALGIHPISAKAAERLEQYLELEPRTAPVSAEEAPVVPPPPEVQAVSAEMLRQALAAAGLDGQAAARELGVSAGTLYAWKKGTTQPTKKKAREALWAFYNKHKQGISQGMPVPEGRTRSTVAVARVRELLEGFAREEAAELNAMRIRLAVARVAKTLNLPPRQVTEVVALTLAPLKDHVSAMEIYEVLSGHSA